jgi:hypothetical protein
MAAGALSMGSTTGRVSRPVRCAAKARPPSHFGQSRAYQPLATLTSRYVSIAIPDAYVIDLEVGRETPYRPKTTSSPEGVELIRLE